MKEYPYSLFYKPKDAAAADFIPFYWDGRFRLFYLYDRRDPQGFGEGTPWYLIETADLVHFNERGEVIPRGTPDEQDLFIFTGSVIRADGRFHIFYTAHNHHMQEKGRPIQAIAHAVSDDLLKWEKLPNDMFFADSEQYDVDNLRDPFVFRDEKSGLYRMACVKRRKGAAYISGFTGQYLSADLKKWDEADDIWSPGMFHTHECPDMFEINGTWYLIYSEYSDLTKTRYVMAPSPEGPWTMPADDSFDGRAFYAAKSYSDGAHRYLFGWIPTRNGDNDWGSWQWGGNLGICELWQRADGTLACKMAAPIERAWTPDCTLDPISTDAVCGRDDRLLFTGLQKTYRVDTELTCRPGTRSFGLAIGQDYFSKKGYKYEFFPAEQRVCFGRIDSNIAAQELERPVHIVPGEKLRLQLIVDCDICVLYINGETVLSSRMCDDKLGCDMSFFSVGGAADTEKTQLYSL